MAAYLAQLDLSDFEPKAPPPKTAVFWEMVQAGQAPEDAEIADVLDALGNPDAVTLMQIRDKASAGLDKWLSDRKNRRVIPHRLYNCGYVPVRNPDRRDGLWVLQSTRQVIYAKGTLLPPERLLAARTAARQ